MGAADEPTPEGTAPQLVRGRNPLRPVEYTLPVASAQLKSAVLLAALAAEGPTTVIEPAPRRDHTERLLRLGEAPVSVEGGRATVTPAPLRPFALRNPAHPR